MNLYKQTKPFQAVSFSSNGADMNVFLKVCLDTCEVGKYVRKVFFKIFFILPFWECDAKDFNCAHKKTCIVNQRLKKKGMDL